MAVESNTSRPLDKNGNNSLVENELSSDEFNEDDSVVTSESDDDDASIKLHEQPMISDQRIALACDDGCVRIYSVTDSEKLTYIKATTRVSGRLLSVTWCPNGDFIYYGSSDGFIRSWDTKLAQESFRITVGLGGFGSGPDLCVWSLLALRNGTLVSADSTGSVQFWDSRHGTLLQAHSCHKGDANALAAVPSHNRVFSAGSDGQVILYELSCDPVSCSANNSFAEMMRRWIYVGYVRAHSHDVRALTIAMPINQTNSPQDMSTVERVKRVRGRKKPIDTSYQKWAHLGVPMLISAGDDCKLFTYSAKEFTKFSPHDICPAPQRVPIELVLNTVFDGMPMLLVQSPYWLDIFRIRLKRRSVNDMSSGLSGGIATLDLLVRVQSEASHKIICCTISTSGLFLAYSNHKRPRLFELKKSGSGNGAWSINKRKLPANLPYAHCMVFSFDSSQLLIAGEDRRIYVVDVVSAKLVHTFTPSRKEYPAKWPPSEPPITKMFTSCDGKWLAATNCFGDIYVFDLETRRQHWFISRLNGASVKAGGFTPHRAKVLIVSTSSNKVYAFNVETKRCRKWSGDNTFTLPRRWQDFPGEVIGLSFPQTDSSSVIIYSARGMCSIDYGMLVGEGLHNDMANGDDQAALKKLVDAHSKDPKQKRKFKSGSSDTSEHDSTMNFKFEAFRDPALFVGHLSSGSVLILDKSWMQVVKTMDAKPVHRHIFGT